MPLGQRLLHFSVTPADIRMSAQCLPKSHVVRPLSVRDLHDVKMHSPNVRLRFPDEKMAALCGGVAAIDVTALAKTFHDHRNDVARCHRDGHIQDRFRREVSNGGAANVLDVDDDVADAGQKIRSLGLKCRRPFEPVFDNLNRIPPESEHRLQQ